MSTSVTAKTIRVPARSGQLRNRHVGPHGGCRCITSRFNPPDEEIRMKNGIICVLASAAVLALAAGPTAQPRGRMKTLTEQEVVDLAVGTAIQGTRSSDTEAMIRQVKAALADGKAFRLVSIDDLPDDWSIVTAAGGIGGGGAWEYVVERTKKQNLPTVPNATVAALDALSKHLGRKFD